MYKSREKEDNSKISLGGEWDDSKTIHNHRRKLYMKFLATVFMAALLLAIPTAARALDVDGSFFRDDKVQQVSVFASHTVVSQGLTMDFNGKYVHLDSKARRLDAGAHASYHFKSLMSFGLFGDYRYFENVSKYHTYTVGLSQGLGKYLSINAGFRQDLDQNFAKVSHKVLVPGARLTVARKEFDLAGGVDYLIDRTLSTKTLNADARLKLHFTKHLYGAVSYEIQRKLPLYRVGAGFSI